MNQSHDPKKKSKPIKMDKFRDYSYEKVIMTCFYYIIHYNCRLASPWTSPGGNTPQDTNCTATCLLSRKLFKLDEPDMQDTAGEAGTNS